MKTSESSKNPILSGSNESAEREADRQVFGWYRDLKRLLGRFEPYLLDGRLVTFQKLTLEEKAFYEELVDSVRVPHGVCAIFIPPSVVQQAMWPPARERLDDLPDAYYGVAPDAGAVAAQRCGDGRVIVNALFAFPPYSTGIDIYQEGRLLAGYAYRNSEDCSGALSGLLETYLT